MNIRNRISQLGLFLFSQIRMSRGGVLLGRQEGAGAAQEVVVGSGLTLEGGTLSASVSVDLSLKANLASPTFTGTVSGITASMVGLGNVTNTSDVNKPVSTAQLTALNLKADLTDLPALTFAGADPNKNRMLVTGGLFYGANPVEFPPLLYAGISGTKPFYSNTGDPTEYDYSISWETIGEWLITTPEGAYWISGDDVATPDLAIWLSPDPPTTGIPTVAASPIPAIHLGQLCKTPAAWWKWNGTAWEEDVAALELTSGPVRSAAGTSSIAADQITPTMLATGIPVAKITGLAATATNTDAANLTGTLAAARIADASLTIAKTSGLESSLPIVSNPENIVHFMNQLIDFQITEYPGDGKYLVVGGGGDSMGTSSGFNPYITQEIARRFGQGAVCTPHFATANAFGTGQATTATTLGGSPIATATGSLTPNFTYLPNGDMFTLSSGSTVTETPYSSNISAGFTRVRCWYGIKAGGGTLTFTLSQNGVALTPKVVDTSVGTANGIGYVDFVAADGLVSNGRPVLVVSNTASISHYLGCYMYLGSGFVPVPVGRGGSSYAQALSSPAANLATFCQAMDMRLCFHAVKEEDTSWVGMGLMMDLWVAQHPKCSHIWVGATASPTGDVTTDPASNAAMKVKAAALKMCFVDGQKLLRNVAWLQNIGTDLYGWNESVLNAPHLSTSARRFIAAFIIDKVLLGFQVPGGRFSPATLESATMGQLSNTVLRAQIWAQALSTIGTTTWTQTTPDLGRLTVVFPNETPIANTGRGEKFLGIGPMMQARNIYSYRISDASLVDNVNAVIMVGGSGRSELATGMANNTFNGFRIIHGVETISAQLIPWIQFAVKGTGTVETLSPKIYHSTSTGVAPYNGGTWRAGNDNRYWIEVLGNGASNTKRFRAWHQCCAAQSTATRVDARRLIADWSGVITVGGVADASTYFGVVSSATPTATGGARAISLQDFSVDISPRFSTDFGQQDFNY